MKKEFNRNHYLAIKKELSGCLDPDVLEALDILNFQTRPTDEEFAASTQGLERTLLKELWINNKDQIFKWSFKGFVLQGYSQTVGRSMRIRKDEQGKNNEEKN
jgi:hypothetical protein